MEITNNKKRILALIEIFRKKSDAEKRLKIDDLIMELKKYHIKVNNRKTLYDDIKILNEFGFNIEYDNGYYLLEAPFNLSEIKIIQDSINSLKNLDDNFIKDLNDKMFNYISDNDVKVLQNLSYITKHKNSHLLQHMEDIIEAIKTRTSVLIKTNNSDEIKEIFPLFLYRANDYYYFYYHYLDKNKIYHYRFDNIKSVTLNHTKDEINYSKRDILKVIEESSKTYSLNDSELVTIKLLNNDEKLIQRFMDDFPAAIHTKDGFSLKASINNVFFAKIAEYGSDLIIVNKNVNKKYTNYLKTIISLCESPTG